MQTTDSQKETILTRALAGPPDIAPAAAAGQRWLRNVNETSAALLLASAPAVALPADSWSGIKAALHVQRSKVERTRKFQKAMLWGGWAAAACLALTWSAQHYTSSGKRTALVSTGTTGRGTEAGSLKGGSSPGDTPPGQNGTGQGTRVEPVAAEGPRGKLRDRQRNVRDYQLVQSVDRLRKEIGRLRAADAERYTPRNGVARIVVMELGEPRNKQATAGKLSSDRLADIVAAGVTGSGSQPDSSADKPADPSAAPSPEKRPIILRPGDTWNNEFVVPAGEPLPDFSVLGLPPGVSIRYGSLPLDDPQWGDNFHPVNGQESTYYDQRNDVIWTPSADHPGEFVGRRPGMEFNKDSFQFTEPPGSPRATTATPQPEPRDTAVPATEANEVPMSGWTIFDETTGKGSIVVNDLAPTPEGMTYRLSFEDAAQSRTVPVGDLPVLENGGGRVYFDLGVSGYSPARYRLDLVSKDAATPVLHGPQGN